MTYDNIAKAYIKLIESKTDQLHVYHAGTFTGGEYKPYAVGEPGNLRPMGSGIYAGDTEYHASRYLKFGGENAKIHKFEVHPDANIFPLNSMAWHKESPEKQIHWREKSLAIQKDFQDQGLVKRSPFGNWGHWASQLSYTKSVPERERMRSVLLKHNVDGAKQVFSDEPGGTEYAFYNMSVLKHIE